MLRATFAAFGLLLAATNGGSAQVLAANEARDFVSGKFFYYSCFDGTSGAGRIHADGSAIGTLQSGNGRVRNVALPVGTLYEQNGRYCANLKGLAFKPCFTVTKTSNNSFRGSINGLSFMSCEFSGSRTQLARKRGVRGGADVISTSLAIP
jgi:hypothetical protein